MDSLSKWFTHENIFECQSALSNNLRPRLIMYAGFGYQGC